MERGTEYGLEQVFNVIDSRYRSGKPLIVTTNLTLDDLRNPEDTAHSRIYDRLLSICRILSHRLLFALHIPKGSPMIRAMMVDESTNAKVCICLLYTSRCV